jgi:protein SCO1/2
MQPVAAATATIPAYDRVRPLQATRPIDDTELTDQDGRPFRLSQLRGQVVLVLFGFTNCPDVCPMAMLKLRQLEDAGGPQLHDVAYMFVSVDGERDTPDVLKAYLKTFSPRFIGLTGESAKVKEMAREFSAVFYKDGVSDKSSSYLVSHSPQIFVIDQSGKLRAEFYNASIEAMHGVTLALLNEAQDASVSAKR